MKDQENLIQRQDTQIIELNTRIKQLEMEKNELLKQQQQSEEQPMSLLPSIPLLSNIAGLSILDDATLQQLTNPVEPIAGTSSQSRTLFAVEKMMKPKHLPKYLSIGLKKEPEKGEEQTVMEVSEEQQLGVIPESASNVIYIPKKSALVLVPPTQKRVLSKHSNPGTPIPQDGCDPK